MEYQKFEQKYVTINGIQHYFLHYPSKPKEPVILFLHGGPGSAESCFAHYVEEYEERNYNIVYYDQRGAGKTWWKNKKLKPCTADLKKDLLEVVLYVKKLYQKDKIVILGHSWGSVLGSMFALEHPEHVLCYIGCGQVVNTLENEKTGYEKLRKAIEKSGNQSDRRKLERIGTYPVQGVEREVYRKMGQVRSLQGKYGLGMSIDRKLVGIYIKSPIFGIADLLAIICGMKVNITALKEMMDFDIRKWESSYQVPVYYVLGEMDQQTPIELSRAYFAEITAPDKKLYVIPKAGHMTMLDHVEPYRKAIGEIMNRCAFPDAETGKRGSLLTEDRDNITWA